MVKNNVRVRRWEMKIKQYRLASRIGVAPPVLSEIENGTRLASDGLKRKIARGLSCTVEDLFPGEE